MIDEEAKREEIRQIALGWLRTPYHHDARVKGVGVDCAKLPLAVYVEAGMMADYEPPSYPGEWHIHRDAERYMLEILKVGHEIDPPTARPGDLHVFKFRRMRVFSHSGIVVDAPATIVHAWKLADAVVLSDADAETELLEAERRTFSFWKP